jgi:copper/silver efflux system protein
VIPAIFGIVKGFGLPRQDNFENGPPPASEPVKRPQTVPEPAE